MTFWDRGFFTEAKWGEINPAWKGEQRLGFLPAAWQARAMNSGKWGSNRAVDHWSDRLCLYQALSPSLHLSEPDTQTDTYTLRTRSISSFISAAGINHPVWSRSGGLAVRGRYSPGVSDQRSSPRLPRERLSFEKLAFPALGWLFVLFDVACLCSLWRVDSLHTRSTGSKADWARIHFRVDLQLLASSKPSCFSKTFFPIRHSATAGR